jgi:hypothetical protein
MLMSLSVAPLYSPLPAARLHLARWCRARPQDVDLLTFAAESRLDVTFGYTRAVQLAEGNWRVTFRGNALQFA